MVEWGKWFDITFKLGVGGIILSALLFFGSIFMGLLNQQLTAMLGAVLSLGFMAVSGLTLLLLLIAFICSSVEILQHQKVETLWKVVWVISFIIGASLISMAYYYLVWRKQLFPKEYSK